MRTAQDEKDRSGKRHQSTTNRWTRLTVGLLMLLIGSMAPSFVKGTPFGTAAIDDPTVPVNCSKAVMATMPKFLSTPKGSAKYPFSMECTSPLRPGLMVFTWEGSWNPSETRRAVHSGANTGRKNFHVLDGKLHRRSMVTGRQLQPVRVERVGRVCGGRAADIKFQPAQTTDKNISKMTG